MVRSGQVKVKTGLTCDEPSGMARCVRVCAHRVVCVYGSKHELSDPYSHTYMT